MKRIRFVGLCLVAMFAVSLAAVASASAATSDTPPEYVKCEKVATDTGHYKSNTCTKYEAAATKDSWEAFSAAGVTFTDSSKTGTLEGENLSKIECKKSVSTGELTGAKTGVDTVTFEECESKTLKVKCQNSGAAVGVIKTNTLSTTLGYIEAAKHKVGTDFEAKTGPYSAEFECGGNGAGPNFIFSSGSVIGVTTAVDAKDNTVGKQTLAGKKGKQTVQNFEGEPKDTLTTTICTPTCSSEGSAEIITSTNTFSTGVSLKAEL